MSAGWRRKNKVGFLIRLLLCDRGQPFALDERKKLERGSGWTFFAAFPLADRILCHANIAGKDSFAHFVAFTQRPDLCGAEFMHRRKDDSSNSRIVCWSMPPASNNAEAVSWIAAAISFL